MTSAALQLAVSVRDLAWMDEGLCQETDPEAFFVEKGGDTRPAKRVCAVCPVQRVCLDYAVAEQIQFGVWGGVSAKERIRRAARRRAA
jgi:WhiB family transcriptional regulator, redox-sensing transcriptional regulator